MDGFNETANIIDGYLVLDEDGQPIHTLDENQSEDGIIACSNYDEEFIYLDEGELQDSTEQNFNESTHVIQHLEVEQYEVEAEDGRLEPGFDVIDVDEDVFVKKEIQENTANDGEDYISEFEDAVEEFEYCKDEPLDLQDGEDSSEPQFQVLEDEFSQVDMQGNGESVHSYKQEYTNEENTSYNTIFLEEQQDVEKGEQQMYELFYKEKTHQGSVTDSNVGDKFFCEECQSIFNDLKLAEEHECMAKPQQQTEKDHDQDRKNECYECTFCHTRLKTFGGLQRHQLNCRLKPPSLRPSPHDLKCKICLKLFPNAKTLYSHKRTHDIMQDGNGSGQVVCNICSTVFSSVKNLKLHRKIHDKKPIKSIQQALPAGAEVEYNELNQFFCEICNKSFDQNLLAVHKNMHQNIEEYTCGTCNRQFENMPSYEMHMQLHADKTQDRRGQTKAEREGTKLPFPCNYCGREFARPHEKVKHERIHTGEKPYECEVCGKSFRVSYSLTLHLRTHTDIRPYVCATCNKRFKSQPVYSHHLNTHLAERPYKCDICSKSFRTSVQLCGHKNSHTKPFNCIECNRPFATLYAVKVHMKTHSKSNKCNENLKHRCLVCGAVYARIFALRFHMKEQHSLELGNNNQILIKNLTDQDGEEDAAVDVVSSPDLEDDDAAVLIAAAAEASDNINGIGQRCRQDELCFTEDNISTQTILQGEEIIVDNFHTEEIVTDWLTK